MAAWLSTLKCWADIRTHYGTIREMYLDFYEAAHCAVSPTMWRALPRYVQRMESMCNILWTKSASQAKCFEVTEFNWRCLEAAALRGSLLFVVPLHSCATMSYHKWCWTFDSNFHELNVKKQGPYSPDADEPSRQLKWKSEASPCGHEVPVKWI